MGRINEGKQIYLLNLQGLNPGPLEVLCSHTMLGFSETTSTKSLSFRVLG